MIIESPYSLNVTYFNKGFQVKDKNNSRLKHRMMIHPSQRAFGNCKIRPLGGFIYDLQRLEMVLLPITSPTILQLDLQIADTSHLLTGKPWSGNRFCSSQNASPVLLGRS